MVRIESELWIGLPEKSFANKSGFCVTAGYSCFPCSEVEDLIIIAINIYVLNVRRISDNRSIPPFFSILKA